MFDIGGPELILILLIALLVFGPRRLPQIGKQLGGFVGQMRSSMRDFQGTLEREVALDEVREATRAVGEIKNVATDAARDVSSGFTGFVHTAPALSALPVAPVPDLSSPAPDDEAPAETPHEGAAAGEGTEAAPGSEGGPAAPAAAPATRSSREDGTA